jgi:NAD+ synthase
MSATIGGKCDVIGLSNLFFNEDFRKKTWEEKVEFRKEINHYPAEIWFGEMQGDNQIIRIEDPKGGRIEMDVEFDPESETTKSIITDKRNYFVNLADDTKPKELIIHNKMVPSFRDAEMRLGGKSSAVEAITDRTKEQKNNNMETINYEEVATHITKWLKNYSVKAGAKGYVLGISGGVDSAVVSTLCARTGLPLTCLEMPIHQNEEHDTRAARHIDWLEENFDYVTRERVDLTATFDLFMNSNSIIQGGDMSAVRLAGANARSRLRMVQLYLIASIKNMLVCGTGNKVEDFGVGFYTKYGDGGVDVSPIADLLKTEVWGLAKHLGINEEIVSAIPSDGLWGDTRSDEDQIGASYPELEWAMAYIDKNYTDISMGVHPYNDVTERQMEVIDIYRGFNSRNQHKMVEIPVCDVSKFRN